MKVLPIKRDLFVRICVLLLGINILFLADNLMANDGPSASGPGIVNRGLIWHSAFHAPDPQAGDQFGCSVAIGGDRVVTSAWRHNDNTGGAHVYHFDGTDLLLENSLFPGDAGPGSMCGTSVEINDTGEIVAISALGDQSAAPNAGAVYVFRRGQNGWQEEAKLVAPDAADGDAFGSAVAVGEDTIVIGARGADTDPYYYNSGAVYVFQYSDGAWEFQARLVPPDMDIGDRFGEKISLHGNSFAVGVPGKDNEFGDNSGAVYIYTRDSEGWALESRITAPDQRFGDAFGLSVALDGDRLLAGSTSDVGAFMAGTVYYFSRSGGEWVEQEKLTAPLIQQYDFFGETVALHGNRALISSRASDDDQVTRVHYFDLRAQSDDLKQTLEFAVASPAVLANNTVCIGSKLALIGEALHGLNLDNNASVVEAFLVGGQLRSLSVRR